MKKSSYLLILYIILISSVPAFSQKWAEMMKDPKANFYDIQTEFNAYWSIPENKKILDNQLANSKKNNKETNQTDKSNTDKTKKALGWKQFKRWEWMTAPRVYPSGNLMPPNDYLLSFEKKLTDPSRQGNWGFIGINNTPNNVYPYSGVGRVNCIRFDPANSNIIYAGTPSGGLWKSTDGGNNWTLWNTDALASLGVSDVAIDPQNSQIIYIASGDRDANATFGIGVLKSTDGGLTWNTTGLNWNVSQGNISNRILIDPTNTQVIHVATSNGIYKSTDAGASFTLVSSIETKDMEFKPGDPTTIYACSSTGIYKSTNSGVSYTLIYTVNGAGNITLAVTDANSNYVYALAADANTGGYKGVYRSTNGGNNFNVMSSAPNILGFDCSGNDNNGQGWYDLSIAASPTNANSIYIGGIFIWSSTDGGATWAIKGSYAGCSPYVFPDVHDLIFLPGSSSTIYAGCDGGVFQTFDDGISWTGTNNGFEIAQEYTIGQSASNGSLLLTSNQDTGTDLLNGTTWTRLESGEATEVIIDRTNNNTFYGGGYSGLYKMRSDDGGSTWVDIMTGITGNGAWVTPWIQDVSNASTLWTGYQEIFKSTNKGANWVQMSSLGSTESFIAIDQAPSNSQVVYAARPTSIVKTVNGGTSWTNVTGNLPVGNVQIKYIEIDPADANHVWVTFSGYSANDKVWMTHNGGSTWSSYSTGLPNLPANCIVYQNNSTFGTLYVGMDVGVYFRDSTMGAWAAFNGGLPNVVVSELEIQYTVGKIRAATYGRGMWESNVINTTMQNLDASVMNVLEPATSTCANEVSPIVKIRNVGLSTITTLNLKYKMDSQSIQTYSWTGSITTMGTANITLPSYNLTAGTHTLTVYTSTPNNLSDQNNLNDTIVYTFTNVANSNALQAPVVEGFTPTTFPPTNWQMINTHSLWSHTTNTGGYGLSGECAKANFFDVSSGTDILITPHLDFQNLTPPIRLYFDVAYTSYNTGTIDSLVLELYDECNNTTSRIYAKGGSSLSTAPNITSPFIPTSTQWRTDTVNLDTMAGKPPVKVRFLAISNYGNNLYLDNVNLNGTSLEVKSTENESNVLLYPNPSKGIFTVSTGKLAIEKIEVYNTLGDKVQILEKVQNNNTIDISNQPSGVYLIHIISQDKRVVKKITLSK